MALSKKRINWLTVFAIYFSKVLLFLMRYKIIVKGDLEIVDGPMLIAPKHCQWTDVPILAILFHKQKCFLNFVMKDSLPFLSFLEKLGGIPLNLEGKKINIGTIKTTSRCYEEKEKVVVFPEGKRMPGILGKLEPTFFCHLIKYQEKHSTDISVIAIDIRYLSRGYFSLPWSRIVEITLYPPIHEHDFDKILFQVKSYLETNYR